MTNIVYSGEAITSGMKSQFSSVFAKFNIVLFLALCLANSQTSLGQELDQHEKAISSNKVWDKFSVSLGGFLAGYNSGITLGSRQLGLGLQIDIEDALGLETSSFVFRGTTTYKIDKRKRHGVSIGYFGIARKAVKVLETDLDLGEVIFPIGTEVRSKFDFTIIRALYDYSFWQDDRISIGASLGLFIMPIRFSVNAANLEEQTADLVAPLPLVGLRFDYVIAKKLYLQQSAELLYLEIDNTTGSLLDLNFSLEHKTFNHFGFGVGLESNRVNFSIKGEGNPNLKFFGDIRMDYTGVYLFGKFYL